jgi:RHS repeat-associated protein
MPAAAQSVAGPVLPLAAFFRLTENSPPGHRLPTAILYQGFCPAISKTATGFEAFLYDAGRRPRCTGQERDSDTAADLTGFDNFLARMLSGSQGRFLSPDPDNAGADPANPQSWNMYSYVSNNPMVYTDPTGTFQCANCEAPPPDLGPLFYNPCNWWGCIGSTFSTVFSWQPPKVTPPPAPPTPCLLIPPLVGQFRPADSTVIAKFQVDMAVLLGSALLNLNQRGIVPTMTAGFRDKAAQLRASAQAKAAGRLYAPLGRSLHNEGLAVDFNHADRNFNAIRDAMKAAGLTYPFPIADNVHFQLGAANATVNPQMVKACGGN